MAYQSYEDLDVWKRGSQLAIDVYRAIEEWRDFSFRDQVRRAAVSIPSNIAEGAERGSSPDFIRFLHYAKGSCAELRTQLYLATELRLIDAEVSGGILSEAKILSAMLHRLIQSLKPNA